MTGKTSMSGLSLRDLEYIQSIAQEGHFGAAAVGCGVSQPAISQQVLKLEARLGFAIFERQGKHVSLTPSGAQFLRKAEVVLAGARELLDMSVGLSDNLEGELRVGVISTLGPYLLPLVLGSIKSRYPQIRLRLSEEPTTVLEQMLADRELDAILIATEPKHQHLETAGLFFEPFALACPADHGRTPGQPVAWADVRGAELVLLSEEHCLRDQTMAQQRSAGQIPGKIRRISRVSNG
ncbi:LysR family transcriptional regulator [Ruegeria pomeroyi]|nr:LysR substrate-binding domain-containing protein [Ruegeria pomeroyi]NVK96785.1 LysR family transcriptional regulator [Ruegeria pomeroyi]NVL00003.1 LysR family transcriptional regulator [Ruegeria pomeroyi]HCE71365.1 DNA-binding transcriptional regulator OxyR [Ruegeria sp.]